MTVIVCGNQKGGVGKSTIACNMAVVLAQQGKDVLLLDADRQVSASEWHEERKATHSDKAKIHCVQKYGAIDHTLMDLNSRYEVIIVDVSGRDSDELRSSMTVADILLIPIKPSQVDLLTLHNMNDIVKKSRWINPGMQSYAFLSIAPTNNKNREIELSRSAVSTYHDITLLDAFISDRKSFRDAMAEGLGVTEMNGSHMSEKSAKREIMALVNEVFNESI